MTHARNTTALPAALDAERRDFHSRDGARIAYYSDTRVDGKPLVLIHSVNAAPSAIEMKPLFEHFRQSRPVFAPELPGFGASERLDREYTASFFAESLADFIADTAGEGADVIALSLSSEFAARAAMLSPGLLRSLALISPTGFSNRRPMDETTGARIVRIMRTPLLGPGLFRLLTVKPSIRHFLRLNFEGPVAAELVDYAATTAHRPGARFAPTAFLSGKLFDANATSNLYGALKIPGLVIYDQDPNVCFDRLPTFLEQNSNWQSARIAPTRGLPHFEKTDAVVAALKSFWAD